MYYFIYNFLATVIVTIILNQKRNWTWYSPLIKCWVRIMLLLVSMNDCVAFYHSKLFLDWHWLIFITVTAGWRHFILLLHSFFLIIWPCVFPIWCYTLWILTQLLYGGFILLSHSSNYCFVYNSFESSFLFLFLLIFIPPFLLQILLLI